MIKKCSECSNKYGAEETFLYNDKSYCAWCLIYQLGDDGTIALGHDNYEEKGVTVNELRGI